MPAVRSEWWLQAFSVALLSRRIDRRLGWWRASRALGVPTLLLAAAPNLAVFALLRIVQGLLMASAFTLTLAYLGETFRDRDAAQVFAAYITGNVAFEPVRPADGRRHFRPFRPRHQFRRLRRPQSAGCGARLHRPSGERPQPRRRRPGRPSARPSPRISPTPHSVLPSLSGFCILFAFIGTLHLREFRAGEATNRHRHDGGRLRLSRVPAVHRHHAARRPSRGAVRRPRRAVDRARNAAGLGLPMLLAPSLPVLGAGPWVGRGRHLSGAGYRYRLRRWKCHLGSGCCRWNLPRQLLSRRP